MLLICTASHGKNLELAQLVAERAQATSIPNQIIDLTESPLPLYTSRSDAVPPQIEALAKQFENAQAFFILSPEYNGSIPPSFTNAVAWLSTESADFRALFNGKVAAIGTHSGGTGQKVLVALRLHLSHLGAHVIGRELMTNKSKPVRAESVDAILKQISRLVPDLKP